VLSGFADGDYGCKVEMKGNEGEVCDEVEGRVAADGFVLRRGWCAA